MFENFVEAVFTAALETVSYEGRGPTEEDAAEAFSGVDGSPGGKVGRVDFGINLSAAFHLVGEKDKYIDREFSGEIE